MKQTQIKISNIKGFTLVETLVAILALSLSLGALTLLTSKAVVTTRTAESRVVAEFLAVEGIELFQKLAMSDLIASGGLNASLSARAICSAGCTIDTRDGILTPSSNGVLYYDATTHEYSHQSSVGLASEYSRLIYTKQSATNGSIFVRSVVSYSVLGGGSHKVVLTKEFQPWYIQ